MVVLLGPGCFWGHQGSLSKAQTRALVVQGIYSTFVFSGPSALVLSGSHPWPVADHIHFGTKVLTDGPTENKLLSRDHCQV